MTPLEFQFESVFVLVAFVLIASNVKDGLFKGDRLLFRCIWLF